MPRLKQAGREANNPYANAIFDLLFGDRDPVAEPGTATGTPGNWWTVFNIVPDAFKHTTEGFQFYRSAVQVLVKWKTSTIECAGGLLLQDNVRRSHHHHLYGNDGHPFPF